MDSNNFLDNVGVGEREARVASELVAKRHYRLAHGIGRSGELSAEQPKAAGSSLLLKLTNALAQDALKLAGLLDVGTTLVLPSATGMALTLSLLALRSIVPHEARYVLWSRIDQKTCLKCITAAGFIPVVIELKRNGDQLETDIDEMRGSIQRLGASKIACVLSTTSCFAPRAPDDVVSIAKLCAASNIPHIINNAYGVQSRVICSSITSASRKGRVDCIVQSTDKNFMVPVGGAILAAPKNKNGTTNPVDKVNELYPGRASASPMLDLLITLLHWGADGWQQQLEAREKLYTYAVEKLTAFAEEQGERVLSTPANPISLALTLRSLSPTTRIQQSDTAADMPSSGEISTDGNGIASSISTTKIPGTATTTTSTAGITHNSKHVTFLGSMLFTRFASGARVIARGKTQTVAGIQFQGYGAHCNDYKEDYITVAAAIGTEESEIDEFLTRLRSCMNECRARNSSGSGNLK